jgi:hypothetical protein
MKDEGYYKIRRIFVGTAQWLWLLFGLVTIGGMIRSGSFDRNILTAARVPLLVLYLAPALALYWAFGRQQAIWHFDYQNRLLDLKTDAHFVFTLGALRWAVSGALGGAVGSFIVWGAVSLFGMSGVKLLAVVVNGIVGGIIFGSGTNFIAVKRVQKALHGSQRTMDGTGYDE